MSGASISPFLTPLELVERWRRQISESTLANWRSAGQGPAFAKIGGRILYSLSDVVAWEHARKIGKSVVALIISVMIALCVMCECEAAETVPRWAIRGIASVESSSYWLAGELVYVDQRDGKDGEIGPFQMTRGAFITAGGDPRDFHRLRLDYVFAERMAVKYLLWLRRHSDSWESAIGAYNTGLNGSAERGRQYLRKVKDTSKNPIGTQHASGNP